MNDTASTEFYTVLIVGSVGCVSGTGFPEQRMSLLWSLIRPCIMHASETWKWSPELLAQILTAEREFGRWCLRLSSFLRGRELDADGTQSLQEFATWKTDTAREVAMYCSQAGLERWHRSALKSYWGWAGHAARMTTGGMNNITATHTFINR